MVSIPTTVKTDPVVRRENVLREDRIKFLSELLLVAHKHREYLKEDKFSPVKTNVEGLKAGIVTARRIRREVYRETFKERETSAIKTGLSVAFGKLFNRSPDMSVRVGGQIAVQRRTLTRTYEVRVGWMWARKVYAQLYQGCTTRYGKHVILSAEKRRVNQKWIELYEVTAYDHDTKSLVNGYVAKTKTDRKNTTFQKEASKAVSKAIELMHDEMNSQLVGHRKEANND